MITRWIARQVAGLAHQLVDEYRKLEPAAPARTELSCTSARSEATWQSHHRAPASARAFGFRLAEVPGFADRLAEVRDRKPLHDAIEAGPPDGC